ncbi:efflux RND transporter periplasmic adaptor subunit [Ancylobacter oerskovii]|uniref:Efflux RND transporter periplasmic adaptor subunit n=1 Tax=Ancylobacter oerskovii TaxID=459519 RepID=A0ABW4YSF3_9HYPH|nr:efflux RND transporter periplasmic adaptor subunit [Ancylobacter oerskovii]MBS7545310.1 efflux RND transporter periplasmic adaptor subunit [Ancylobacter oerskovii]
MPGSRHRRGWVLSSLLLAGLAAGYGIFRFEARPPAAAPAAAPVPVETARAGRRDVPVFLTGIGTVEPFNTVTVRSRVDGELQQVLFREGQDVRKGDLLAVIDPRTFEAALQEAQAKLQQDEASLANARLILDRDAQLGKDAFASTQAVDNQRSAVQQLEAQIAQDQAAISTAQTQLSYTRIAAPIDGRAGLRLVDEGNIVHASDVGGLVVLNQLHPISVISTLPQADVPAIRAALDKGATPAQAMSREGGQEAGGQWLATGTVELIDNKIDPQSGTLQVKSVFANADDALWPGQFVELRLQVKTLPGVVTVPADAVQRGPAGAFVFVVGADGRVTTAPVTVGPIADGIAVIEKGIEPGQTVVVHGQYRLAPGTAVTEAAAGTGG